MPWLVGYPREQLVWYPTVDADTCIRCGLCMNCGKKVYEWTKQGPVVVRPNDCVPGCTTCANLCPSGAISFPPLEDLRAVYKREKIWAQVTKDLKARGVLDVAE